MGVVIAHRKAKISGPGVPLLILINLVIHPLCVYLFLKTLGPFDPVWEYTAILMACLPPALNVYVMATDYKVYIAEASSIVLLGTLLAVITVTGVLYMINAGLI